MKVPFLVVVSIFLNISVCFSQSSKRIEEIRNLYKEYNEELKEFGKYEFSYFMEGDETRIILYTDLSGRVLMKTILAGEFSSWESEFYFKNDSIQFIFTEHIQTNHWMEDTAKYDIRQNRYYFKDVKIIKCLTKELTVIGDTKNNDISKIPNKEKVIQEDLWNDRLTDIVQLYSNLENTIKLTREQNYIDW